MKNPGARNSEDVREENANIPRRKTNSFGKERTRSEGFPETAVFGATLQMSGRRKEKRMNPKALETEGLWQDYETSGVKGGAEPQAGEKTLPGHSVAAAPGQERRRRRGGGGAARGGGPECPRPPGPAVRAAGLRLPSSFRNSGETFLLNVSRCSLEPGHDTRMH